MSDETKKYLDILKSVDLDNASDDEFNAYYVAVQAIQTCDRIAKLKRHYEELMNMAWARQNADVAETYKVAIKLLDATLGKWVE